LGNLIQVGGKNVGDNQPVFVIAEVGINHNGDLDVAYELIDKAVWAGASAVKFQTYITEKRVQRDSPIFEILKQCELSFQEQGGLFDYAKDKGILAFSTPFDSESVSFLSETGSPCFKIASFDLVNKPLLEDVARSGKPIIMSRGMANQEEIDMAMDVLKNNSVILLHCVSAYPVTQLSSLNLTTIRALQERYQCPVGYSDHTIGVDAARFAVAAGAVVIEKHFTLSRALDGPDHALSSEPDELKDLVKQCNVIKTMLGEPAWSSIEEERDILQYRRKH